MEIERKSWSPWFQSGQAFHKGHASDHPLDGCDDQELYQIMMSERADLVKAKRESEDRLVSTIIKFASTLIVLMVGFSIQKDFRLTEFNQILFVYCATSLVFSVMLGLLENFYSSKAYESQVQILIAFYTKAAKNQSAPIENTYIYFFQMLQFLSFGVALLFLAIIAGSEIGVST